MTPLDRDIIRRELERITENLRLLIPVRGLSPAEYSSDIYRRKATERLLQGIVESAVDINAHVLVSQGRPAPDSLYSSFLELGDLGVLDHPLAAALAPSAGLRNRLIHQYDRLDDLVVLGAVVTTLELYPRYVASLERLLEST